jgi:serine/threonine protein kinase
MPFRVVKKSPNMDFVFDADCDSDLALVPAWIRVLDSSSSFGPQSSCRSTSSRPLTSAPAAVQLDNIMLHGEWPRPILKICDFGYSKDEVGQSVSKSTCGTPEYMAPEVLFEEKVRQPLSNVNAPFDQWAKGVPPLLLSYVVMPLSTAACAMGLQSQVVRRNLHLPAFAGLAFVTTPLHSSLCTLLGTGVAAHVVHGDACLRQSI